MKIIRSLVGLLLFFVASQTHAQLVANDDIFGVPYGGFLQVEEPGVLKNDTRVLDGKPETDFGGTAVLVAPPANGTLRCLTNPDDDIPVYLPDVVCADGSFEYISGPSFTGTDSFTYFARFAGETDSNTATVTLSACTDEGGGIFSCWVESVYRNKLAELGYSSFDEGFEKVAWESVRSPNEAPEIISQGISWTTNHPATNDITTGSGPARTGLWGAYDRNHGVATGTELACDVDDPDPSCLFHDGLSGSIKSGGDPQHVSLHGVGGYITGIYGANIAIILDGASDVSQPGYIVMGKIGSGHQFFGVIDATASGFTEFKFQEEDGKIGQALYVWTDDFIIATSATCLATGYDIPANQWMRFAPPCNVTPDDSVEGVFTGSNTDSLIPGDYGITWVVFRGYEEKPEYVELIKTDAFTAGTGYWVYSANATTVGISGSAQVITDIDLVGVPSTGRDNYLGHNQNVSVDWSQVQVVGTDGTTVLNYGEYGVLMSPIMYKWIDGAYQGFDGVVETGSPGTLDPFDAFWVQVFTDGIKLKIPALALGPTFAGITSVSSSSERLISTEGNVGKKSKKPKKPKNSTWYIRLIASGGGLEDPGNVLGQVETASEGNDRHDLEEPAPFDSKYFSILFTNPLFEPVSWGFTTDFRAMTKHPQGVWPFVVKSHAGVSEVTLRWEGKDELFKNTWLVDEENGQMIRAKVGESYTFEIDDGEHHFRFEVGE